MSDPTVKRTGVERIPAHSWYALGVLTLVYVLNFLDRVLIYFMFTPIKAELKFTDLQLGLLGATSFAIFYTVLGIPFGRLADRGSRKRLIAGGLAVWSLFSGLTGFTHSFETMFLCRLMVGVGEATLGPAALSLLSDYFPVRMRASVTAAYSSAIAIGSGLAFALGGQVEGLLGWRWAFFLLGFPGLLVCLLVLSLREARRGETEREPVRYAARDWKVLFRSAPLRYHYAGYALFGLASNQLSIWGVTFFARVHGLDLKLIGLLGGLLSLLAGVPGTILGGVLADRLRRRGRGGRMFFSAACALLSVPLWLVLLFSDGAALLLAANFFLLAFSLMWLGAAAADVHDIAGPQLRGLGVAVYFFAVNLAAYGVGAPLVGHLNDRLGAAANPQMMRYALLLCPLAAALAALLLWRGSRKLESQT
ncbi:MAG TPA: MFS transporter [Pyrinomonadaceae bacterium]|jgi:MFS family permease|nr:MFS transporter [Pyrinomonadaceae bacterium]